MISHKKLIVPVVALMLCAVAVIGVGFAYSGTYNGSGTGTTVDSYALEVDKAESFDFGSEAITVKFDTAKTDDGNGVYTFNTTENTDPISVSDDPKSATLTKTIKIKVTASEKAATGSLSVTPSLVGNGFVTRISVASIVGETSTNNGFDLSANSSETFTVTLVFALSASGVTDDNVDSLVIPGFSITATASTS